MKKVFVTQKNTKISHTNVRISKRKLKNRLKNQNKKNTLGVTLYFEVTDMYELPLKIVPPMLLFSETISFDN